MAQSFTMYQVEYMNDIIIEMFPGEAQAPVPPVYRWGLEVIRVIQGMESPALTALIRFITALGTEMFYVPLILVLFWWVDEKRALRLGLLLVLSAWINMVLKDLFRQPRPFTLEPSLGLAHEESYGIPSAHAQGSLTFWVPISAWLGSVWKGKRALLWAGTVLFLLLMGFTRLYLGVHFPTDILAGWFLGGIILFIYFVPGPALEKKCSSLDGRFLNIITALLVLAMNGLYPRDRTLPALFLGFSIGYTLMKQRFPFSPRGEIQGKKPGLGIMAARGLTGFAGGAILFLALGLLLPGEGSLFGSLPGWGASSPLYDLGRFILYGTLGFWFSAGAPRMFQHLGLAEDPKK